jgi:hypothetical protein
MLPEPLAREAPGLRLALPSEQVGRLDLMLFVASDLRREPRVAAVRDFVTGLLAAVA